MSNQDDELDKILDELSFSGINDVSYCPGGHKLEQYARDQAKAAILDWHKQQLEQAVIEARIEQSWRCRELVEANADSPDEQERYGDIVLLDVDDLKDELVQLSKPKGSTS